jgi:hypothetical protein
MSAQALQVQQEAILRQGGVEFRISLDDAQQMRIALLDALKHSQLGDRDTLIALTNPLPAWIDSDGRVMLGGWMLQLKNSQLVASYRLSRNAERAVGYSATISKDGNVWRVLQIVPEKIRFGR